MGPRSRPSAAVLVALLAALAAAGSAPSARPQAESRAEILVGFQPGVSASAQRELVARLGGRAEDRFRPIRVLLASVRSGERSHIIAALERAPRVRSAEPTVRFHADQMPNDGSFGELWGLDNTGQLVNGFTGAADADIDAPQAWEVTTGTAAVTVGVIDTGVDGAHPDLAANMWVNPGEDCAGCRNDGVDNDGNGYIDDWRGWDFLNNDNDPYDDHGHGTHVAGTIGAIGDNARGVAGVNWSVSIMPLKFLGADGSGDSADAVRALLYASAMGADVTNNSWGGDGYSQALADAIADADSQGSLFVAAAGNSFANNDVTPHYPSSYDLPNMIAVAATDQSDARAWFSNYGRKSVDLGAPGTNVFSTWPGAAYEFLDGTSMAAPHVAGAVALAKAAFPTASGVGLKALLLRTVDANASLTGRTTTQGRLNVGNALACASAPQVWLDAPAPAFNVAVGQPFTVRIAAARCGDPGGVTVDATANGTAMPLTARGDGLYVATYTPTDAGAVTIQATAAGGGVVDVQTASGVATQVYSIVPGGEPVTVTTTAPDENARVTFDGVAGRRVSLRLTNVTIGSSSSTSAKVSILKPDGSTLVAPAYFGRNGGFVDVKTLPVNGEYTILIDPQGTATGSATLTLYDVPPDAVVPISAGGSEATVTVTVPGQNARLPFAGTAGRRISLKLDDVTIGTSLSGSAKVSILKPDGTALVSATLFGTNGGFVDVKSLPVTGTYTILVDPQSNAIGSATLTLYDVPPDASVPISAGGTDVTATVTVPGQDARLPFAGTAGRRISVKLTNVTIGSSSSTSAKISVLKPDGTALVSATYFGTSGGFVDVKSLPVTGTYTILVDPQSNAVGSATVTLYDVPADASAALTIGGAAATLSMTVPGQNGAATFTGSAGQNVTLTLTNVTIGSSGFSSAKFSIRKPDGTNLVAPTFFGTSGKTLSKQLPVSGTYTIVIDPQSSATGNATLSLSSP
jgi:subtilisin family serine protease